MIFKCKMCGGTIEFEHGATVGVCDSCGTKQTLPKLTDDKKTNIYERAGHYRRTNEFDKAMALYEQLVSEDSTDAEAHWSIVLCRYGIEYVEDPNVHKRVPTVNRVQYKSILEDNDYIETLRYADAAQKEIIISEAKEIDRIQKGILDVSRKEEPFDIFICYKESDNYGRRTQDSVIAYDIYKELIREGYRVFFARITLEDKLGTAYEPYIFAALNSARIMLAIGTSKENFNAVWVKNEWSRYLALMREDSKRVLIPVYRDMNPYDMPEEFAYLQSQDYSKIGAIQDLVRGINKLLGRDEVRNIMPVTNNVIPNSDIKVLIERCMLFLEDAEWSKADQYAEQVLNTNPKCAEAYLCKLMVDIKCRRVDDIKDYASEFTNNANFQKVIRFGDQALSTKLKQYNEYIIKRNEVQRLEKIYLDASLRRDNAKSELDFFDAAEMFKKVTGYKDADENYDNCIKQAERAKKEAVYTNAKKCIEKDRIAELEKATALLMSISDYEDSLDLANSCKIRINKIREEQEKQTVIKRQRSKKIRRNIVICLISLVVLSSLGFCLTKYLIIPSIKYHKAMQLYENEEYGQALLVYRDLGEFRDSYEKQTDIINNHFTAIIQTCSVGDVVFIGDYEWIVLDKQGDRAFVMAKDAVVTMPYNNVLEATVWSKCSLREWLNDDFYKSFPENVRKRICLTVVANSMNKKLGTEKIADTDDYIYLLDENEYNKYVDEDNKELLYKKDSAVWWLRTTYNYKSSAVVVGVNGQISEARVKERGIAVRPVMWIDGKQ